ncbi:MAG: hypothetical protein ACODAC_11345, partial [Pseudomonadota bacterium]
MLGCFSAGFAVLLLLLCVLLPCAFAVDCAAFVCALALRDVVAPAADRAPVLLLAVAPLRLFVAAPLAALPVVFAVFPVLAPLVLAAPLPADALVAAGLLFAL